MMCLEHHNCFLVSGFNFSVFEINFIDPLHHNIQSNTDWIPVHLHQYAWCYMYRQWIHSINNFKSKSYNQTDIWQKVIPVQQYKGSNIYQSNYLKLSIAKKHEIKKSEIYLH